MDQFYTEQESSVMTLDEESPETPENVPAPVNSSGQSVLTVDDYHDLAEKLGQQVVQVRVRIERYRGKVSLKDAEVEYQGKKLQNKDGLKPGSLQVLPDSWESQFNQVEGRLRSILAAPASIKVMAYAWMPMADGSLSRDQVPLSDSHVVSRARVAELRQRFDEIVRDGWHPLVEKLLDQWDEILQERQAEMEPEAWSLVEEKLPANKMALRKSFRALWIELPLGFRLDDLTVEALQRGAGDYLEALRESIVQQSVDELKSAAGLLLEKLDGQTARLRGPNVTVLTDALAAFRSFGDMLEAPGELTELFKKAESLLAEHSIKEINHDNKTGALSVAGQLKNVLEKMSERVEELGKPRMSGGKYQRKINL